MRIGFIGAGKTGFTLGKYFTEQGITLEGYYSRSLTSAQQAATFTNSKYYHVLSDLVAACDTLFITVPDGEIKTIWEQLKQFSIQNKNFIHCSGVLTSQIFSHHQQYGAKAYSLHPLYAIHDRFSSYKNFSSTHFTLEGTPDGIGYIENLITTLGNPIAIIDPDKKVRYHAACVFVSNLTNALAQSSQELFASCDLPSDFVQSAWHHLLLANAENICQSSPIDALTGPIERGDVQTVSKHLNSLDKAEHDIYRHLSFVLVHMAKIKHPDRDYHPIEAELNK